VISGFREARARREDKADRVFARLRLDMQKPERADGGGDQGSRHEQTQFVFHDRFHPGPGRGIDAGSSE